jgi:hypothetical protein
MDMETKVAAFCQEIAGDELASLAADKGMTGVLENARTALASGDTDARLEADLDALDTLMKTSGKLGMYPPVTRSFKPLPGASDETGAQWWTCPGGWCAGRGRVRPQHPAPVCAVAGQVLTPRPVLE